MRSLGAPGWPGWTGRDAEWLALVCLHGGVFLRPQHLAFLGQSRPELARRFVRRCGRAVVEERWNATGLKLCRIRAAIATLDDATLATYGCLNEAVARCAALETAATENTRAKPMITAGRTWLSRRVRE